MLEKYFKCVTCGHVWPVGDMRFENDDVCCNNEMHEVEESGAAEYYEYISKLPKLLNRDDFRKAVFERDNYKCVICGEPAQDAHHIMERRLFDDGGYYIDNGASLCGEHHIEAEQTVLTCDEIRAACSIQKVVLPEHMYDDNEYSYDKWGNVVLPNGMRMKGELFFDESVQKILKAGGILDKFLDYVKYPRTFHLPWSENVGKDDKVLKSTEQFEGKEVVVLLKMDGENSNFYCDYFHARSLDSRHHVSRNWIKNFHSQIGYQIPEGWRICGENLYAKHSIKYENLESYFYVFSIWNEINECLNWDETVEYCQLLDLVHVPVVYRGSWDENTIRNIYKEKLSNGYDGEKEVEGYVVRTVEGFPYSKFRKHVGKFVRKDHVRTHAFWMKQKIEINNLRKGKDK